MVEKKQNFDIDRRFNMLQFGLSEHDAATFLKDNRAALILSGAKVGSIPKGHVNRIELINKLRGKSQELLLKWVLKNISNDGGPVLLTHAFELIEKSLLDCSYDGTNSKKLWQAVLIGYADPQTQSEVDDFLKTDKKITKNKVTSFQVTQLPEALTEPIVQVAAKVTRPLTGIVIKKSFNFNREIFGDAGDLPVLGYCTTVLSTGQFFIRIAGAIVDDSLMEFTESEAKLLFPETGDATGYSENYFDTPPPRDFLALWRVKYHNDEKKTRYLIDDFQLRVFRVYEVPHPSNDPDHVRSWIQNEYHGRDYVYPVFQLADGVIIKPSGSITEFSKYNFDTPFNAYSSHEAIAWQGKLIVIKPFPAAEFKYDCAGISTVIKRLFKARAELSGFPVLTKGNLQNLAALANKETDDGLLADSTTRAIKSIEHIFSVRENVETFFADIMGMPEVVEKINEVIESVKLEQKALLENESHELEQIATSKQKLLSEIQAANQAVKNVTSELTKEIKRAFERASKDGVKTLADVAVLQPFLTLSSTSNSGVSVEKITSELSNFKEITTFAELGTSIGVKALQFGVSPICLRAATSCLVSTGILGLSGDNTSEIISATADIISAGKLCSVSISADMFSVGDLLRAPVSIVTDRLVSSSLGQLLEFYQDIARPLIVELKGFNRIPPESVLNELLAVSAFRQQRAVLSWRNVSGLYCSLAIKAPIFFILTFSSGRSTFPIVGDQAYTIPLLDTGIEWPDRMNPIEGKKFPSTFIANNLLMLRESIDSGMKDRNIHKTFNLSYKFISKLALTLESLGELDDDASLISCLIFSLGRYENKDLNSFLDTSGSVLSGFISEYLKNSDQRKMKYIFEI
jgi:hypothetical protein